VDNVLVTAFLGGDSTWKLGEGQSCINSINVRDTSEKLLTLQHPFQPRACNLRFFLTLWLIGMMCYRILAKHWRWSYFSRRHPARRAWEVGDRLGYMPDDVGTRYACVLMFGFACLNSDVPGWQWAWEFIQLFAVLMVIVTSMSNVDMEKELEMLYLSYNTPSWDRQLYAVGPT
jgi:hypothetical protein